MKTGITLILSLLFSVKLLANNITVANVSISNQNTTSHSEVINFDVAWENSWRTSTNESNYDGAWIFVKFRKQGTSDWRHCTINTTGWTAATGGTFSVTADGKGALIYKSVDGIGNVNYTGNKLIWNYGADGILDNETVEIRLFALEMVYIPQGSYYLGSGGTEANCFKDGPTSNPYLVANNNAITTGSTAGQLNYNGMGSGNIPATFPKGFSAIWVMKYECSQQQYVDFLNHIDLARATANKAPGATFITGTHPNFVTANPERAMGTVGFVKNAAFMDWSGLRPMSELEYEKICRGYNTPPVANEYPWGTTSFTSVTAANLTNVGMANETVSGTANCNVNSTYNTSTRVGLFARTTGSSRSLSGATYYGVMNMGDNQMEIVIYSGQTGQSIQESVHGDGYLQNDGATDIAAWRVGYTSWGLKGSSFNYLANNMRTSDRANINWGTLYGAADSDQPSHGIRGVRTAP